MRLPTGDGMALAFFTSPDAPVKCAIEISKAVGQALPPVRQSDGLVRGRAGEKRRQAGAPALQLRMGINSGPVDAVSDVNDRSNVAGAGINMAQRVMDCGDAGHILLSKRVADDLGQYEHWRKLLHDLGECEVKHGMRVSIVNLHADQVGNPQLPKKFHVLKKRSARVRWVAMTTALLALAVIIAGIAMFSRYRVRSTLAAPEKSIAVLPFENRSEDKANAYFADGIQDEILTRLSK